MRPPLQAISARLVVGRLDTDEAIQLLDVIEPQGKAPAFLLGEPEGVVSPAAVGSGAAAHLADPVRLGKIVLETVANEYVASTRSDPADALVDGLRVAHRRLGPDGLDLVRRGASGVGFCGSALVDRTAEVIIVPPSQAFILHQGAVQSIPEASELGRSIWMRDDLRAEMFAGVGGAHEPDIRIYEAGISPGDTLVLLSSALARMLSEDDIRRALSYEEAAIAAERLRNLALQRGVDGGLALVIEIGASLERTARRPEVPTWDVNGEEAPRPQHWTFSRPEMPPVGAIFATARQRLLEALERSQAAAGRRASGNDPQPELEVEIPWPRRQRPGQYQIDSAAQSEPPFQQPASVQSQTSVQPAASAQAITRPARAVHRAGRAARLELPRIDVAGRARGAAAAVRAVLTHGRPRWNFLPPALVILLAVGLVLLGVHTVQTQQRQQLNQRFDSLISAAQQLEGQARTTADQAEAQSLIRRSQALVDQAAKLRHDQVPATTLRKALQADLDRLNKIDELPDPAILATFDGMDKHANAAELTGDSSALYVLGGGQGKVFQVMRVQKTVRAVLAKGQKVGQTEVATPVLLASRDGGGLLVLDSEHHLWQYEPSKGTVTTVGLQDAGTWKNAQDLGSYGQNLYVLDPTAGNILRYVPHGTQYSLPPSRFFEKDNQTALGGAVSMAIDGSIWLATSDGHILKLSGGQIQPFSVSGLPQPLSHAIAIFTTADTHSLYVLDSADRVVQLGKDGAYQRQLNLGLHGTATSLWVDELNRNLYVLAGNKLYAYQLPL